MRMSATTKQNGSDFVRLPAATKAEERKVLEGIHGMSMLVTKCYFDTHEMLLTTGKCQKSVSQEDAV